MSLPAHAVTPTDCRPARPARPQALHPANVASREQSALAMVLALRIADGAVRDDIEEFCAAHIEGDVHWFNVTLSPYDMQHPDDRAFFREVVDRVLTYIGLRNPDGMPWRFVRHPERPELVRFETRRG